MEAYQGYFENGRFIPFDGRIVPENRRAIVTILDEAPQKTVPETRAGKQRKAFESFLSGIDACAEELGPEFDGIINQRVNITRELDL